MKKGSLFQSLKNQKKIKECFKFGKVYYRKGLFCKILKNCESGNEENLQILIGTNSSIKTKVKKNRIKRIIKGQLISLLQSISKENVQPVSMVIIGKEDYIKEKTTKRSEILLNLFQEAGLLRKK